MTSIEDVKRKNEASLMGLPGVVGVGLGSRKGMRVIQVYVQEATREVRAKIPDMLEGHPVEVVRVGEVRKL